LKRNQYGDRRLKKKNITIKKAIMMPYKSTYSSSQSPVRVPHTITFVSNTPQVVSDEPRKQLCCILSEVLEHTADEDFIEIHELEENPDMARSDNKLLFDSSHTFNLSNSSFLDSFHISKESFDCNFFLVSELLEPRPIEEMMQDTTRSFRCQ
jgi:hypothetical protein